MAFANPVSNIIVQSGTDTDLSGLSGVSGVTHTSPGAALELYDLGDNIKLQIDGTLTINGTDTGANETLIVRNADATHAFPLVYVASGGTLNIGHVSSQTTPTTNFSSERFYPSIIEAESQDFDDGQGLNAPISGAVCPFLGVHALGTLNWYGCLNFTTGLFFDGSGRTGSDDANVLIDGGVADCRRTTERGSGLVGDNFLYNYSTDFDCQSWTVLSQDADDRGVSVLLVAPPIAFKNFVPVFTEEGAGVSISAAAGLAMTIENYNGVIGRSANRDWRSSGPGGNTHVIQFHNGSKGSELNIEEEAGPHASILIKQLVRGTLLDAAGADRIDAVMATQDKDSTVTQDNTIVTGVWDLGLIQMSSIVPALSYTFANPSNTDDDLWNFYVYSYLGLDKSRLNVLLRSNDGLDIEFIAADDLAISQLTKATTDAYTDIRNLDRLYDRAKSFKIANVAVPDIVTPMIAPVGTTIDLGALALIIDGDIGTAFAHAAGVITIDPTRPGEITRIGATEVIVQGTEDDEITIPFPSGILDNDVAYIFIGHAESEDNAWNTPSGWTVITAELQTGGTPASVPGLTVFRRVLSSDSGSVTVDNVGTNVSGIVGQMVVYRNVDTTTPEDVTSTTATGASGDPNPPSIDPTNTNTMIVAAALGDAEQILNSVPANYTAINDTLTTAGGDEGAESQSISFIDATENGTGSAANNLDINVPTHQEGDLLILVAVHSDASDPGDFNDPSGGWTVDAQIDNVQTGGAAPSAPGCSVWYKYATGSEPASYNLTTNPTASQGLCAQMFCFRNADAVTAKDVNSTTATGDGTNANPPSINSGSGTDKFVVLTGCWHDATTITTHTVPSGYTDPAGLGRVVGNGGGNGCTMGCAYSAEIDPAAAEDPGVFTTSTEQWGAFSFAIRPASGGGRSLDGCFMATADRLVASAAIEDPGTFDFNQSEEWCAHTMSLRFDTGAPGDENFDIGAKFNRVKTTGNITVRDTATINGTTAQNLELEANIVVIDDVINISDLLVVGDMHLTTGGTYAFSNVTVTGDILNNDGAANALINGSNGSSLSTSEPGTGNGQVNIIQAVTLSITVLDTAQAAIENARVEVRATETVGTITTGDVLLTGLTNASGVIEDTAFNYETAFDPSGLDMSIKARQGSVQPFKVPATITGVLTTTGFAVTIELQPDE